MGREKESGEEKVIERNKKRNNEKANGRKRGRKIKRKYIVQVYKNMKS